MLDFSYGQYNDQKENEYPFCIRKIIARVNTYEILDYQV